MSPLTTDQARRVESTFAYVDRLLQTVERLAHTQPSPFGRETPDLSSTEAQLLLALVESARGRMLAALDHLGLPRPKAQTSTRWSIETTLRFADIELSELSPETLRGYGAIDRDAAMQVSAVAAELRDVLERGRKLLRPEEGEQLRERLESLADPLGEILREAESLSREHGLVEVRPLIVAAAERATANTVDVGIFGRVSAGKSSLINAVVGEAVLPVGATPVTAVPLRVVHGERSATVSYQTGRSESIAIDALTDFATEAGNPDNTRGVTSIAVCSPLLPDGLALLDTPGVGSMSQSGPSQAFAWLPRCDFGLVLVAAGTPIGRDELALVGGLRHAGIAVEVLLSKSDLIPESERATAVAYVRGELVRATGDPDIVVRPVSVTPGSRGLFESWRREVLEPLIAARRQAADAARRRRLQALVAAIDSALSGRGALTASRVDLQRRRVEAEREIRRAAEGLETAVRPAIERAATAVADAWASGADARAVARQILLEPPNRALDQVRTATDRVSGGDGERREVAHRVPPLFDLPLLDELPIGEHAGLVDRLAPKLRAANQLGSIKRQLDDAYSTYGNRIRAWGKERLDETYADTASTAIEDAPAENHSAATAHLAALVDRAFGE